MKRLFVEDLKGYMETFDNVDKVEIVKPCNVSFSNDKRNHLYIIKNSHCIDCIPLSEIKLAFMVNTETMEEYFRYRK